MTKWRAFYRLASPAGFYHASETLLPWLGATFGLLMAAGLYGGLITAPADYQQGDGYRIIFVHVPAAWMSLFIYTNMACLSVVSLVWRGKLAGLCARASAPLGASFTFITLATGSLWGKPMWGAWWVWDARLTSELILLFLYLGYMALIASAPGRRATDAGSLLLIVGAVNIPIIHFSVDWWNTLHQPATVAKLGAPSMPAEMLQPLLLMAAAFMAFYFTTMLAAVQAALLTQGKNSRWAQQAARNFAGGKR